MLQCQMSVEVRPIRYIPAITEVDFDILVIKMIGSSIISSGLLAKKPEIKSTNAFKVLEYFYRSVLNKTRKQIQK